ncbi:unnamed protein product [Alopecurus aequalis]
MALARWLLILLLVAKTATTGASEDQANSYVIKCYPPPTSTADGGSAFRGNLLNLLEVLPSAAAPTGFASLQIAGRAASDRALVNGLCFGDSAPEPCHRCLSDAAKEITLQCGDAIRRAGFWDEHCFLAYADGADSSSARADDDYGPVSFSGDAVPRPDKVSVQRIVTLAQSLAQRAAKYGSVATADATTPASKGDPSHGNRTVRVLAQCARDRGAADCVGCLREASLAMAKSWEAGGDVQGSVASVLGSNCYLRFEISAPPLYLEELIWRMPEDYPVVTVAIALAIVIYVIAPSARVLLMSAVGNAAAAVEAMSAR